MKIKTLIPFVVILALLAGIVVWQKMNQAPPAPIATQIGLKTLAPEGLDADDIARIELFTGSNPDEKVVLEEQDDKWKITSAYNAPVNQETLNGFLEKALGLKGEPRAKENTEEQLASYELKDDEAFHVQLFKSGAETPAMHVLVGKSADFRTVFVRKEGDNQVFVESTNLRRESGVSDSGDSAVPTATKWLQTTLLKQEKDTINRVALQYPDKDIVFERHEVVVEKPDTTEGEGEATEGENATPPPPETKIEWKLAEGGFADHFTDSALQTLLTKFSDLAITNVVDPEQKADWGFDPPLYKATISCDEGEDIVLLGGRNKPGGDCYVKLDGSDPPLIYQMATFNFEQIFPQGSKLFPLPEWKIAEDAMQQIQLQRPDGTITITKDGETWNVTDPAITLELQKTAIDSLVTALSSLKPVDYADAGVDVGSFDTTIVVSLNSEQTRILHLGGASQHTDGCYAKFDDSDKILALSRADMEKLTPPLRDLYKLSLMDFDPEAVEQIAVSHTGTELLLKRDAADTGKWQRTVNGEAAEVAKEDVAEFIYTLNAFQVDDFLLDQTPDMVRSASTITVTPTEEAPIVLSLSAESDATHKAIISGMSYVFSVKAQELANIVADMQVFLKTSEEKETPDSEKESSETNIPSEAAVPESLVIPAAPPETAVAADENVETTDESTSVVVLPPEENTTEDNSE